MVDKIELPDGWQYEPGSLDLLARAIGNSLVVDDETVLITLLEEIDALLDAGHERIAGLLAQAAVYRANRGPVTREANDTAEASDPGSFDALVEELLSLQSTTHLRGATLDAVGRVLTSRREFDRARDAYRAAAKIWRGRDDLQHEALSLLRAGASAHHLDDVADATVTSRRARDAYRALNDTRGEVLATLNLSQTAHLGGDADQSQALLDEAAEIAGAIRDGHISASILLERAILRAERGELTAARRELLRAYRSARRRNDLDQAVVAAKNLASVAEDEEQPGRAVKWWATAADLADEGQDWREAQEILRLKGVRLAELGRFDDALLAFDAAIALNASHEAAQAEAQSRADKGAVLLNYALSAETTESQFQDLLEQADETTSRARVELEALHDYDWAGTTVRNLRTAWTLRRKEAEGAKALVAAATSLAATDETYAAELMRNAGWLMLAGGAAMDSASEATGMIVDAVSTMSGDPVDRAWALAREASTLGGHGHLRPALEVFDAALGEIDPIVQASAYGNILNDSALIAVDLDDLDDARARLARVEAIARQTEDRVLLGLAIGNLAEVAVKDDDPAAARKNFEYSAELARQTGDTEQEAFALASIANTYIDEERVDDAAAVSEAAVRAAALADTGIAIARATSAAASVAYSRGDYEAALAMWTTCAERTSDARRAEYQAFVLDCLARLGDWTRFRRHLERNARESQKSGYQFDFAEQLRLPALTWLRQGRPRAAGTVVAYGVLLSFDAASKSYGPSGRKHSRADLEHEMVRTGRAMGLVRAMFLVMDLPEAQRRTARKAYEDVVRRVAGPDASMLIEMVDEYALADDEDD